MGHHAVGSVTFGPVTPEEWRPVREKATTVDVDLLVVGFGLVPNAELSSLAGCEQHYQHELGGFIPVRDERMRTTSTGVFAAGDGAGVAGVLTAVEEGRIAGITAAEDAGALSAREADRRRRRPLRRLRSLGRARMVLDEISRIRPGLVDLATPTTTICRCEEVSLAQVLAATDEGAKDLQALKLLTRLGMGPCQGRNCESSAGAIVCAATGAPLAAVGRIEPRPPVKPVTLGALARGSGARP
jgi:NADPH-dependent 2,4-dienoyl-CoA reductase/sulfur reductase-like enzyme